MPMLPAEFADLESVSEWCLPDEDARYAKRLASSMDELQAFYDVMFPRLEDALAYLDALDVNALPEDATHLLELCNSLMTVSFPIEVWRQARVPDSGAAELDCIVSLKP